jgi:hypothetical protein
VAISRYHVSINQGQNMPKTLTNKQIVDGINKVAENYFKASNARGLTDGVRQSLTLKWAHFREMAVMLSQKNPKTLESIVFDSQSWLVSAEQVAAEASK